ncbi:MAG: adenylate/guanylate cyclase domain-containing protein [Spirochaetales bacterium]|nr:adenylate/guanylate cyclase domain-containing protein [Spirochaetales bacterium]
MKQRFPFALCEDPKRLAGLGFWQEEVYKDMMACQEGTMSAEAFKSKYGTRAAMLCLDMTGFTRAALNTDALFSFFRILNIQKVCTPIFHDFKARIIHAFADNFTVIFDDPRNAVEAAMEVHRCVALFNDTELAEGGLAQCCIGIGYGDVYAIGHDRAMGDEMNRSSKLGEDIAKGSETLITENVFNALKNIKDYRFFLQMHDTIPFKFYCVQRR